MPYWQTVTNSFGIAWRHKYLWLLALFAGESGGTSLNFNQGAQAFQPNRNGGAPNLNGAALQVTNWIGNNLVLILALVGVWLVLVVLFFVLAAVCEGALVRASAEHDADRPFGLGIAWRCGVATMGTIIRFRLLLILLGLPVFIVLGAVVIGAIAAFVGRNNGAGITLILVGLLLVLASIPYAIYLSFLNRLGARAVVLEQVVGARAAIVRAHRLLRQRLGRVLLVWLLSIAVGFAVGIVVAIVLAAIAVPMFVAGVAAYSSGSGALAVVIAIGALILLPALLLIGGFQSAQESTYWTLAFRRLELEPPYS